MSGELRDELLKRKRVLLQICADVKRKNNQVTEGTLRINGSGNREMYYHVVEGGQAGGVYIKKKDMPLARDLAQKDYYEKVLRSIEKEITAIDMYLSKFPKNKAEQVYESLHIARQKLITPIRETDEQYRKNWEMYTYQGKSMDESLPLLFTERGERVRSKSEMIIADLLYREDIPYRYECPLFLRGYGTVYPDFTVLDVNGRKEIYWEHLGLMDDPSYVEKNLLKIDRYEKNGIVIGDSLILTWETKNYPINQADIRSKIEKYLKKKNT